jgi:putative restriction endonuclease
MPRFFGPIAGVSIGSLFDSRRELHDAGVHAPLQAGISGSASEGADSIVVSGGYEDDEDYGDVIVYTGHGGNDPTTGRQVADQVLERGNLALAISGDQGFPVRVVRGAGGEPAYSPPSGYRYDGVYFVADHWSEIGRSGYRIWRFRLVRDEAPAPENPPGSPAPGDDLDEHYSTVQRVVRNTAVTQWVKELHDFRCQICGTRLETASGAYAEGAHIKPRGRPHDGPDSVDNVLCLCANDHVRFDRGSLVISDGLEVSDRVSGLRRGRLRLRPGHRPAQQFLAYHRALWEPAR